MEAGHGLQPPPAKDLPIEPEPAALVTVPDQVLTLVDAYGTAIGIRPDTVVQGYPDPRAIHTGPTGTHILIGVRSARHWVRMELIHDFVWNPQTGVWAHPGTGGSRVIDTFGRPVILPGGRKITAQPTRTPQWLFTVITDQVTGAVHLVSSLVALLAGLGGPRRVSGPLFRNGGPHPDDPRQGELGECWLLAPMKNQARYDPDVIIDMLHDYGDGTFGVRFFHKGRPLWMRVTRDLYTDVNGRTFGVAHEYGYPLWPVVIEKAYVALEGGYKNMADPCWTRPGYRYPRPTASNTVTRASSSSTSPTSTRSTD
jgi:hypothetical protein